MLHGLDTSQLLNVGIYFTCGLAVVIALNILKTDSISITLIFIVTFNLPHTAALLAFTFLNTVIGVPLFTELTKRFGVIIESERFRK